MNKGALKHRLILRIAGLILCILPPLAATLCYFPVWAAEGTKIVSGITLLLLALSALPLYKLLRDMLRSPASYTVWLILFLLFALLSKIAEEMTVISFVGFISNTLGAVLLRLGRKEEKKNEE